MNNPTGGQENPAKRPQEATSNALFPPGVTTTAGGSHPNPTQSSTTPQQVSPSLAPSLPALNPLAVAAFSSLNPTQQFLLMMTAQQMNTNMMMSMTPQLANALACLQPQQQQMPWIQPQPQQQQTMNMYEQQQQQQAAPSSSSCGGIPQFVSFPTFPTPIAPAPLQPKPQYQHQQVSDTATQESAGHTAGTAATTTVSSSQQTNNSSSLLFLEANVVHRTSSDDDLYNLIEEGKMAELAASSVDDLMSRPFSSIDDDIVDEQEEVVVVSSTTNKKRTTSTKDVPKRAAAGKLPMKPPKPKLIKSSYYTGGESPQDYLNAIWKERGYDHQLQRISSKTAGYSKKATPLQLASFGSEVVKACNTDNAQVLSLLLDCGLSPNPTNKFGDTLLHLVCKRANERVLQCLIQHGCDLQVADSFGRTPLHHVAWSGTFSSKNAKTLLDADVCQILVEDQHHKCPLEYVRTEDWPKWIDFLRQHVDEYWPVGGGQTKEALLPRDKPPRAASESESTISLDLASQLASGAISPDVVKRMDQDTKRKYNPNESLYNLLCR